MTNITAHNAVGMVDATAFCVYDILSQGRFEIPDYQRDFVWQLDHAEDLWQDLSNIAGAQTKSEHFIGNIVINAKSNSTSYELVDGQQRMTVFLVLMIALLDHASDKDKKSLEPCIFFSDANGIQLRLKHDDGKVADLLHQLATAANANDRLLVSGGFGKPGSIGSTSHTRLARIFEYFHAELEQIFCNHASPQPAISQLVKTVLFGCNAIVVDVASLDKVFDVFERLNNRGLKLGQADLVKNRVYAISVKNGTRAKVDQSWKNIRNNLQKIVSSKNVSVSASLAISITCSSKWKFQAESKLLKLADSECQKTSALAFTKFLECESSNLEVLLNPPASMSHESRDLLYLMRKNLSNKYFLVLPLATMSKWGSSSKDFDESVRLTNSYLFRRFASPTGTAILSVYQSEICGLASDIRSGAIKDVTQLKAKMKLLLKTGGNGDAAFKRRLLSLEEVTPNVGFYLSYMMESVASSGKGSAKWGGKNPPNVRSVSTHLEHVMPQSLDDPGWQHMLAQSGYLNHPGNLLVLPGKVNSSVQNKSYADKLVAYKGTAMVLARGIDRFGSSVWDEKTITARWKYLVNNYALQAWAV